MNWKDAKAELEKGNCLHLKDENNYLYLSNNKHYIVYSLDRDNVYQIKASEERFHSDYWEVDNKYKDRIIQLLKKF